MSLPGSSLDRLLLQIGLERKRRDTEKGHQFIGAGDIVLQRHPDHFPGQERERKQAFLEPRHNVQESGRDGREPAERSF